MSALLDWISAIGQTLPALQAEHTPTQWGRTLRALVERFFASADEATELAIARLLLPLDDWLQACEDARLDSPLPLAVVREHWLSNLAEAGLRQRFFGGGVQFGTLMPMRAIPFKVIALLGMNDGAYPRVQAARDFDLMASNWRTGDRSRREDDRYLFLEALLSARQKLYVSWQGHSGADNSERPPSVLVAQLLDLVNACWSPPHQPQAQPLQPFSSAYFEAGSGFVTYAQEWQNIQLPALSGSVKEATEKVVQSPPSGALHNTPTVLSLAELQRLLRQPVEVFWRQRLRVEFDSLDELEQEDEPFGLNHLQQYQLGAALLQSGADAAALVQLHGAGVLPLAGFGQLVGQGLLAQAQIVWQAQSAWLQPFPQLLDAMAVDLVLQPGLNLTGELSGLHVTAAAGGSAAPCLQLAARTGPVLQGKPGARTARGHTLGGLWLRHLAGCASGLVLTSVQLGVDGAVAFRPLTPDAALHLLRQLAHCYLAAWDAPLPLACKTAWTYLQTQQHNPALLAAGKPAKDPHQAARQPLRGGSVVASWPSRCTCSGCLKVTPTCSQACHTGRSCFMVRCLPTANCCMRGRHDVARSGSTDIATERLATDRSVSGHWQDLHPGGAVCAAGAGAPTGRRDAGAGAVSAANSGDDIYRRRHS